MGATKIMVIRHAERPGTYYEGKQFYRANPAGDSAGTRFYGVNPTGDAADKEGRKHLITLGWQRAGALVPLFVKPWGPADGLATPDHLFASDPDIKSNIDDVAGPSQRPCETLMPIAAKLRKRIDTHYKKNEYGKMIAKGLSKKGAVLIAWQHEDIPLLSQEILDQTETLKDLNIPKKWPKGLQGPRYDLVFVFDRPSGEGRIKKFRLFGQMLLVGDAKP
jgi:hypothetical protein